GREIPALSELKYPRRRPPEPAARKARRGEKKDMRPLGAAPHLKPGSSAKRASWVRSESRSFCWPSASKFDGASQARKASDTAGQSSAVMANEAVSRLRPFTSI